jgi:hypothetical protein
MNRAQESAWKLVFKSEVEKGRRVSAAKRQKNKAHGASHGSNCEMIKLHGSVREGANSYGLLFVRTYLSMYW